MLRVNKIIKGEGNTPPLGLSLQGGFVSVCLFVFVLFFWPGACFAIHSSMGMPQLYPGRKQSFTGQFPANLLLATDSEERAG